MTDIVLVNPNHLNLAPFAAIEPPFWLGLIAGYLQRGYLEVAIVDAEAEGLSIQETVNKIESYRPKETIIVVMGSNPATSSAPKMKLAEELLIYFPGAKLAGLPPVAIKHPNVIAPPFSGFPVVPWDLLPMDKYKAHNWHCLGDLEQRSPYAVLYTSMGCPYECSFCNIYALYGGHKIAFRPLEDVFAELTYFANKGIRNIKIWDECFTLSKERIHQICDYIIAQGYKFNIWAYARIGTVEEHMLKHMKQAGFNWLAYGFESANETIRRRATKNFGDLALNTTIRATREVGINIIANFMFGLPGETEDTMKESLNMATNNNFEYINFTIALPYPGSEWYEKLNPKSIDWSSFDQFGPDICAAPEVVKFRDKAFTAYFSRPEYLDMIASKFGSKAREHIGKMLNWRIREGK